MSYQFVHIAAYGRQKSGNKGTTTRRYKSGIQAETVRGILAEAAREPANCPHVENPQPPELVMGIPLQELENLHDTRVEAARTHTTSGKERRLRKDQKTLLTVVASYPVAWKNIKTDSDKEDLKKWQDLSIKWARERYGDQLKTVILHVDEEHPHLHMFILPGAPEMRAQGLHPGVVAKAERISELTPNCPEVEKLFPAAEEAAYRRVDKKNLENAKRGKPPVAYPSNDRIRKSVINALGDKAYKDAMGHKEGGLQQEFYKKAGIPCGMTPFGPRRRRLTTVQWKREQEHAGGVKELVEAADKAEARYRNADRRAKENIIISRELVAKTNAIIANARNQRAEAKSELTAAHKIRIQANRDAVKMRNKARSEAARIRAKAIREASKLAHWSEKIGRAVAAIFGVESHIRADERTIVESEFKEVVAEKDMVIKKTKEALSKQKVETTRAWKAAEVSREAQALVEIAKSEGHRRPLREIQKSIEPEFHPGRGMEL